MTIRTRFAPSPTGFLHIGGLRTALYSFLFAHRSGGQFVLRIEDTDQSRAVAGAAENLVRSLDWAGVTPDEGVMLASDGTLTEKGDHGPYTQSQRLAIYREHVEQLLESGHAYYCFCDKERLDRVRKEQQKAKKPPMYDRHCRALEPTKAAARAAAGEAHVVRLAVPDSEEIVFEDAVRGTVRINSATVDDQVILKSDGFPTYHLASVVDDRLMRITHVIRGEEWLPSTPKHIVLYRAFGWTPPTFAHVPLLLNPDKSKLSKRQGDVAVEDYMAKGFLPEALVNFVALLGWNPGKGEVQEIFTLDELLERFSLDGVNKAGAVCDLSRLRWFNAQHIKRLTPAMLLERALPFVEKRDFFRAAAAQYTTRDYLLRVAAIVQERLETLADFGVEHAGYFFARPTVDTALLRWKDNTDAQTRAALEKAHDVLVAVDESDWTREHLTDVLMTAAGDKRGDFLWPLRVALTGAQRSPSPMDCAWVLGKEETLARIEKAIK